MRIDQWIKNSFMVLPLFFAGKLFEYTLYMPLAIGFLCYSLAASSVYIFNDWLDIEEDKIHPKKSKRPLASGRIKKESALFLMVLLQIAALPLAFFTDPQFFYLLLTYLGINFLYSVKLKQIPVLDLSIIAIGFILRVQAGGLITDITLSKWLLIITFLLAFFLGLAKRRDDVLLYNRDGKQLRKSIQGYNLEFINLSMVLMAGVIMVAYIMYTTSHEIESRLGSTNVYLTSFFVLLGLLRYLQISIVELNSGSPTAILLKDRFIQLTILGWITCFYLILYKVV
jgi:4-hydroxybenzoate polyprenyltransferase